MADRKTIQARSKPNTHTKREIYDNIKSLSRHMRKNPTSAEDILWQLIRKKQMLGFRFRRQYAIDRFIVDFYCPSAKLVIEVDGEVHDLPERAAYDAERRHYLESLGITVLRFSNEQIIGSRNEVLMKLNNWLSQLTSA